MNRYEALQQAIRAHGSETDWCGNLYIYHPMAVADRIEQHAAPLDEREDAIIVALLHDVWEDTNFQLDNLSPLQYATLERVTRWPGETYREYIEKAAADPLSIIVKLADLSHNMSDERKENLDESQLKRAASLEKSRYIPSRDRLWEALGSEWWPA